MSAVHVLRSARPLPVDHLTFVREVTTGKGHNFWNVQAVEPYAIGCVTGAALAREYVAFLAAGGAGCLPLIVRAMGARSAGAEVGFLVGLDDALTRAYARGGAA